MSLSLLAMSVAYISPACSGIDTASLSDPDCLWLSNLNQLDALKDSPGFRQSLTKAELIAAQIQAHYSVTLESCQQAIKAGEAFASALSSLAQCVNLRLLPKEACCLIDGPSHRAGLNCDPSEGLHQVQQLLLRVASCTSDLATRFKEPEHIVSEARKQIEHLLDLRVSFHRISDQLDSSLTRLASVHAGRSQSDLGTVDSQIVELRQIYQNTASAYLSGLRTAISSVPLLTYLRSNSAVVSAEKDFIDRLKLLYDGPPTSSTPSEPPIVLLEFLSKLTNWADTSCRMTYSSSPFSTAQSLDVHKQNAHAVRMEGYLFKRSSKRTWRTWARRWFRLSDNQLVYCKRFPCLTTSEVISVIDETVTELKHRLDFLTNRPTSSANGVSTTVSSLDTSSNPVMCLQLIERLISQSNPFWKVMEPDLRLCTARDISVPSDRRFTFELISHGNRIHVLQADSHDQRERWVEALRSGLMHLQQSNNSFHDRVSSNPLDFKTHQTHLNTQRTTPSTGGILPAGPSLNADRSVVTVPVSQQSIPDYEQLRSQGGVILWREPYGFCNRSCADCLADGASWASINLGVTLCTQCAAAHRGLGVHVSKIRSLTLDNWEPELLHLMLNLGNQIVNMIYEANLPTLSTRFPRPTACSPTEVRRRWIRAKWVRCQFVRFPLIDTNSDQDGQLDSVSWIFDIFEKWSELRKLLRRSDSQRDLRSCSDQTKERTSRSARDKRRTAILSDLSDAFNRLQRQLTTSRSSSGHHATLLRTQEQEIASAQLLLSGAHLGCPPIMLAGLATGAHPDGSVHHHVFAHRESYPPLIAAVRSGSLAACEFLLLNGADIDIQDDLGRTPLHHACLLHRVNLVCLLLRRRADQGRTDNRGRLPLDIAVDLANADIVTLLRLQRLHDDDRSTDFSTVDDTVTDVFRDYTSRAYFFDSDGELSDHVAIELRHASSSPTLLTGDCVSAPTVATVAAPLFTSSQQVSFSTMSVAHNSMSPHFRRMGKPTSAAPVVTAADVRRRRYLSPSRSPKGNGQVANSVQPVINASTVRTSSKE